MIDHRPNGTAGLARATNTGARVVESSFSMRRGTWSGPPALLGFIPVRSFSTH